jgi:hypothetical protein
VPIEESCHPSYIQHTRVAPDNKSDFPHLQILLAVRIFFLSKKLPTAIAGDAIHWTRVKAP